MRLAFQICREMEKMALKIKLVHNRRARIQPLWTWTLLDTPTSSPDKHTSLMLHPGQVRITLSKLTSYPFYPINCERKWVQFSCRQWQQCRTLCCRCFDAEWAAQWQKEEKQQQDWRPKIEIMKWWASNFKGVDTGLYKNRIQQGVADAMGKNRTIFAWSSLFP